MGYIFYLMGKSSSGKDTIYRKLLAREELGLRRVVPYTTRPIREGEEDGKEYFFIDDNTVEKLRKQGAIIELRAYDTCHGIWKYMTVDDGTWVNDDRDCLMIGTLEAYGKMCEYFGPDKIVPVMVVLDDGVRLQRALNRERKQENPKYEELCRRFLADAKDFSPEALEAAGVRRFYENEDLKKCVNEIAEMILSKRKGQ